MLLVEIINSKVDYQVVKQTADLYHLESTINNRKIKVTFSNQISDVWDFEFSEYTGKKWTTGTTGSGLEFRVFSFVKESLLEFIQIYHPKTIEFTAFEEDGSKRGRLYEKFLKKLNLPNYYLEVGKNKSRNDTYFALNRKD